MKSYNSHPFQKIFFKIINTKLKIRHKLKQVFLYFFKIRNLDCPTFTSFILYKLCKSGYNLKQDNTNSIYPLILKFSRYVPKRYEKVIIQNHTLKMLR